MASVRLNIAYKSILVGACLMASLWNAKCEGTQYSASTADTHAAQACPSQSAARVVSKS